MLSSSSSQHAAATERGRRLVVQAGRSLTASNRLPDRASALLAAPSGRPRSPQAAWKSLRSALALRPQRSYQNTTEFSERRQLSLPASVTPTYARNRLPFLCLPHGVRAAEMPDVEITLSRKCGGGARATDKSLRSFGYEYRRLACPAVFSQCWTSQQRHSNCRVAGRALPSGEQGWQRHKLTMPAFAGKIQAAMETGKAQEGCS
jgi:hypothetical protein